MGQSGAGRSRTDQPQGTHHQAASEDYPLDVWEHVLRTNLTGYLMHAKAAAKRMTSGGRGGSIVNVSSISGASALGRGNLAFGVSKAGVDQLTREPGWTEIHRDADGRVFINDEASGAAAVPVSADVPLADGPSRHRSAILGR